MEQIGVVHLFVLLCKLCYDYDYFMFESLCFFWGGIKEAPGAYMLEVHFELIDILLYTLSSFFECGYKLL